MNAFGPYLALLDSRLDTLTLLFGLVTFAGGVVMMFQHLRHWRHVETSSDDQRLVRFEWYKFRRRTLVGALIAGCGAIITSLANTGNPYMYVTLVTVLVLFLVLILVLATMDLMSVGVFQITRNDGQKQQEILNEIIRKQKLKQLNERPSDRQAGNTDG